MASSLKKYRLQLALDFLELKPALELAHKVSEYIDVMEAGTPLIKSEGMKAVTALKQAFPDKLVNADLKSMDVGFMEAEMAYKAGADIASVCAAGPHETVQSSMEAGKKYGKLMMVDFIGCNVGTRFAELERENVRPEFVLVHTGIDQQLKGKNPLDNLRSLQGKKLNIAVAGGLNEKSIPGVMALGANHLIVGGAITGNPNPKEIARKIREVMEANIP